MSIHTLLMGGLFELLTTSPMNTSQNATPAPARHDEIFPTELHLQPKHRVSWIAVKSISRCTELTHRKWGRSTRLSWDSATRRDHPLRRSCLRALQRQRHLADTTSCARASIGLSHSRTFPPNRGARCRRNHLRRKKELQYHWNWVCSTIVAVLDT